jgi:hypothetical protein
MRECQQKKKPAAFAAGKFNREVSDTLRGEVEEESREG